MKKILLSTFFIGAIAVAGLPPTTSKISGDSTKKTTFNYEFPNFTGTHNGATVTLGVLSTAGGGTGSATQNFVDLTTTQSVAGVKNFSDNISANSLTLSDSAYGTMVVGKELTNFQSTGLISGGVLSINATTSKFDLASGEGWIVNSSNFANVTKQKVTWSTFTAQTVTNIASQDITYILINSSGSIVQQATFPTASEKRSNIFIGRLNHVNRTSISFADTLPDILQSPMSQVFDLMDAIAPFSYTGNIISANGANLSINKSVGKTFNASYNYAVDNQSPNNISMPALTAATFRYIDQDSSSVSDVTVLDPTNYDVGGVVTAVGGTTARATVQRVYLFPSNNIRVAYGQEFYANLADAIANYQHEAFVENPSVGGSGVLIAYIAIQRGCTSLLNTACSHIIVAPKFGGSTGAAGATTTNLQQAYDNSVTPQITTTTTLGSLDIKRGSAADTDFIFRGLNGSGSATATLTGAGVFAPSQLTPTTALGILYGGTGQTTKSAAFDALSPMTTGGDLIYGGASGTGTRLANGSSGQFLMSNGTTLAPTWSAVPAGNLTGDVTSTGLATTYSGTVPATKGGTGQTTISTGDILYGSAANTLSKLAAGTNGTVLTMGASTPSWATPAPRNSFLALENISFVTSVGSSALTIALKDSAGADPSSPSSIIGFRSSTLTSGAYVNRTVTSAVSIVVSSGSTLGHSNGVAKNIWLYAIDNAGTVELAVSSKQLDETFLYSTTAEGGAGAADSESVIYSTTARTNVAVRLIGRLLSSQTTAGTWAAVPTNVSLTNHREVTVEAAYGTASGQSISNGSEQIINFQTKVFDSHNAVTTGASWKYTVPSGAAGTYEVRAYVRWGNSLSWTSGSYVGLGLYKNGSAYTNADVAIQSTATLSTGPSAVFSESIKLLDGDYVDLRASHGESSARALLAAGAYVRITIKRVGDY